MEGISMKKVVVFGLFATLGFAVLIVSGFMICTLCGVNQFYGIDLGMLFGIVILLFVYERVDFRTYNIVKK